MQPVLARLRIDMEDRGGRMELLLPYATLEPVRELLLQQFMGEKFGRDFIWETHLAEELWNTEVELDVVLDEQTMRLSDVMKLQPGDRIVLNTALGAPVWSVWRRCRCSRAASAVARTASPSASSATCRGCSRPSDRTRTLIDDSNTPAHNGGMEWILELGLVALLAATLFHAVRLERALGVLKRDRVRIAGADRRLQCQHASGGSRHRAAARRRGRRRAADRAPGRCGAAR